MKIRYIDNGDGTVTDTATGLMWQKVTVLGTRKWKDALKYCEDLRLAGYSNWRIPTTRELVSLIDEIKPDTQISRYWSSSPYALNIIYAWFVSFYYRYVYGYNKNANYYVRAVRGGRKGD